MTMINDKLFGELEYKNNFWRGKITIKMFNLVKEILLSDDAHENADFLNIQREAFLNFIQDMNNIMNEVEKGVYQFYSKNVYEYREMLGDETEADKIAPRIDSPSGLAKLVKPTELIVRRVRKNGKRRLGLGLLCDVTWNMEDGLGIKMEDEMVEEVGYQDIVL